jgi:hypothetical protein
MTFNYPKDWDEKIADVCEKEERKKATIARLALKKYLWDKND